ncbi:hypothetical protein ACVINW_002692 [Bradyrhizobium sp. USDA 4461]
MDTVQALGAALDRNAAIVLFSGGQDSTTVLAWALNKYRRVETVGFEYGQKHSIELEQRLAVRKSLEAAFPIWSERLGPDHLVKLDLIGQVATSIEVLHGGLVGSPLFPGRRYIPGRNLIMLSMCASIALTGVRFAMLADCARRVGANSLIVDTRTTSTKTAGSSTRPFKTLSANSALAVSLSSPSSPGPACRPSSRSRASGRGHGARARRPWP